MASSSTGINPPPDANRLLQKAAKYNDSILAREALKLGADINAGNRESSRPIHIASENGFTDVVKILASVKNVDLHCEDVFGYTPLALAISMRHIKVVTVLLQAGTDPNQPSIFRSSPCHLAVVHQAHLILKLLLRFGAKVDPIDCFGKTPLYVSIFQNKAFRITKILLDAGANPNFKSKTHLPLLSEVVLATTDPSMLTIVRLLVAYGARVNEKDEIKGETALHKAAIIGYEPVISFLVSQGAILEAVNVQFLRPYDIALLHFNKEAAEVLNLLEIDQDEADLRALLVSRRKSKRMRIHF